MGSYFFLSAGADIKEMQAHDSYADAYNNNILSGWDCVTQCQKPVLAAVNGFAV